MIYIFYKILLKFKTLMMDTGKLFKKSAMFFFIFLAIESCAYRFTNTHMEPPAGIRTIAIESIYDTSKAVLPHEMLWSALQRAFAKDGHLRVVNSRYADAIVRAHIQLAQVGPMGEPILTDKKEPKQDPKNLPEDHDISEFRRLSHAGKITQEEAMSATVLVEVIDLRTNATILSKIYPAGEAFRSLAKPSGIEDKSVYLAYEEGLLKDFQRMSNGIAEAVVNDLLVRY